MHQALQLCEGLGTQRLAVFPVRIIVIQSELRKDKPGGFVDGIVGAMPEGKTRRIEARGSPLNEFGNGGKGA